MFGNHGPHTTLATNKHDQPMTNPAAEVGSIDEAEANHVRHVATRLFAVPLPEVLTDAKHGEHTHFELVTATVTLENGC